MPCRFLRLFLCLCALACILAATNAESAENDLEGYVAHPVNGFIYWEDPDIDFNSIVGAESHQYLDVPDDGLEFDSQGRVTSIAVYDEDTDEFIGRFPVTYKGNDIYINGKYFGTYTVEGVQPNSNVTSPSGEVTAEEVTRQSSRTTTRIVGKRVAAIMAPRPAAPKPSAPDTPGAPGAPQPDGKQGPGTQERQESSLGYELAKDRGAVSGLAAGEAVRRWGAWANAAVTKMENSSVDAQYSGALVTSLMGMDYKITDRILVGMAVGYEYTGLGTTFNDGQLFSHGITAAPYVAFAVLDSLILDVMGSVTYLSNQSSRAMDTLDFTADYDSWRTMISSNLNYYHLVGNWNLNASTGFTYSNEYTPEYEERGILGFRNTVQSSNAYVGEWNFGARVGYYLSQMEPYVALSYLWDPWMSGKDSLDNDEVEASLGLNIMASDALLVTMELTHSFLRKYVHNTTMMCSVRYEF